VTYPDFEARWVRSGGAEHANYGLFLQDLCDLLAVPRPDPTTDDPTQDAYVFERGVSFDDGAGKRSTGRIDLYKRGCFVLETKQGVTRLGEVAGDIKNARRTTHDARRTTHDARRTTHDARRLELGLPARVLRKGHAVRGTAKWGQMIEAAREQALRYVRALPASEPRPPFVVVVDVGFSIDLYSNFAGVGDSYVPFPDSGKFRVLLPALADPEVQVRLRLLFTDPQQLDPARLAAQVTRRLAGHLAGLSSQLEKAGHAPDVVAQFLMRCLFTMFAEDVELIPKKSFSKLLAEYADTAEARAYLPEALASLWATMDKGGFSPALRTKVRHFNGKLFHDATALPLNADQVALLQQAAAADWTLVEPAIFGTLLERALDPKERHSLGAHYTPRRYVERLVLPTVIEPLRQEWAAAQAASTQLLDAGKGKKAVDEARAELLRFLRRLTSVRILDPACGSGNFLYVTLEHLKRLEGEVLTALGQLGQSGRLELGDGTTVGPRQLLGLELNPRAAAIADVVLRIGYLQWHLRTHGLTQLREPLLDDYQNIQQQDAVLSYDGPAFANARPAVWPEADFIVGNPPFIGKGRIREALGDAYVTALRKAHPHIPDSVDLVLYWWDKAAQAVRTGATQRFGFITTNSITQTFNRRVIQAHLEAPDAPAEVIFAIPDHPWTDNSTGAAVRVAFTAAEKAKGEEGTLALVISESRDTTEEEVVSVEMTERRGRINADLTVGADVTQVQLLRANEGLSSFGLMLAGAGFIVTPAEAEALGLGSIPGIEQHIRPYRNGKDLAATPRGVMVIDLFGLSEAEVIARFPTLYQQVFTRVKPERDSNRDKALRERWWLHGRSRQELRKALVGLTRYIGTPETAKHRIFQFLDATTAADHMIVALALDDALHLGVLSSRIHTVWAFSAGGRMGAGNDSRYNSSRCFQPFPFPVATGAQQARIRELAEARDAHRKRQQAQHPSLTLTDLYNVVEKLRAGQPLTAKEQTTYEHGLAAVVLSLHQQLDAAVAEAYGWPADLPEADLLTRLVQLNHTRQQEEAAGTIRYLRPVYQAPDEQQATLTLPSAAAAPAVATVADLQPWPVGLAQQMQAVRGLVQQGGQPLSSTQVAARFRGSSAKKVQPLLDTLALMALVRFVEEENKYAA
jgi:hypothetical protein